MDISIDKENMENVYSSVKASPAIVKQSVFKPATANSPSNKKKKISVKPEETTRLKEELAQKNEELAKKNTELAKKDEEIKHLQERLREQEMESLKASLSSFPRRVRQIQSLTAEKIELKKTLAAANAQVQKEQKYIKDLQVQQQRDIRMQQYQHQEHQYQLHQHLPPQQILAGLANINYYPGVEDDYHPGEC